MEAWTDSLLDTERAPRKSVRAWSRQLIKDLDRVSHTDCALDENLAGASNNYALIVYLLGEHGIAQRACERQIEFSDRCMPKGALQPKINLIRLHRGVGRYDLARGLLDELFDAGISDSVYTDPDERRKESNLLERTYLHERFFIELKVSGPGRLPALLSSAVKQIPSLDQSAQFAERLVMAGMLCSDGSLVREGLSKSSWKSSPHAGLVRAIYAVYWLAVQGQPQQAIQLVRRMAGLGLSAYTWKDHAILRILERLHALALLLQEAESACQLNFIRGRVAAGLGDISGMVATAYHHQGGGKDRNSHVWLGLASRSGYRTLPGVPQFFLRKKTIAEDQVMLRTVDFRLRAAYESYGRAIKLPSVPLGAMSA